MGEKDILDISMLAVTSFSLERKNHGVSMHFEISIRDRTSLQMYNLKESVTCSFHGDIV
jgi:hypothetical protein